MTAPLRCASFRVPSLLAAAPALAGEVIVPNRAPTTAVNGGYTTVMHAQARSYQLVVGPEELGALPVGARITGIHWRRPTWIVYTDWPGTGTSYTFSAFDVSLSTSNNPVGSLSTTYTDNIGPDVVQVRGGPLTLSGPVFPGGALTPAVNPLGDTLPFTTPYVYKGGPLLLTIRHTGNGINSGTLDTVSSPYYQAIGVSSYTQASNWYNQGLITMKLVFEGPAVTYCTAKTNSCGGAPSIGAAGSPSATASSGFVISSQGAKAGKAGLLLYGDSGRATLPFSGGTLCVAPPVRRTTAVVDTQGTPPACDGVLSIDMNAFASGQLGGNPQPSLTVAGTVIDCQFWGRDTPGNALLSDAAEYVVQP